MTILFMTDDLSQIGGVQTVTTAGTFDPDYASSSMRLVDNVSYAVDFGAGSTNEVWIHYDMMYTSNANLNGDFLFLSDVNGNLLGQIDWFGSRIRAQIGSASGSPFTYGRNILRTLDVRYQADGLNVTLDVYVDGAIATTRTISSTNTQLPRQIDLGGNNRSEQFISQLAVADTPLIGRKIGFIRPASAGADSAWTGGFAELGDTNIASIAFSDTPGQRVSSVPTAWAGLTTGTIERLVPIGIGAASGSGPQSAAHYLKIGGTNYDSTPQTLNAIPDYFISEYATNPDTGSLWTFADLATIELGLLSGT